MLSSWPPEDREGRRAETGNACGLDTVKETTVAGFFFLSGSSPDMEIGEIQHVC